jgi:cytochrome oxidase Cu insertion factor (SCO1/SenC/PrrC family)
VVYLAELNARRLTARLAEYRPLMYSVGPGFARATVALSYATLPFLRDRAARAMDTPAVRAPDFPDTLEWVHAGGRRLTLADFRGKLLLLDFWTYG